MKTHFVYNNVTEVETLTLKKGIDLVTKLLQGIDIPFIPTFSTETKQLTSYSGSTTDTMGQTLVWSLVHPSSITKNITTDNTCLIYDWTKVNPRPTLCANHGKLIQIPMQWYGGIPEVFAQFFLHELCHDLIPDLTHNQSQNPAWSQKPPTDYYIYLLKTYYKPTINKPMYKYFKPSEIVNLSPELVKILDDARGIAGVPFKITNGFRTPTQNANIEGSAKNSPHMRGLAADLQCTDSRTRSKMLWGLMQFRDKLFIEVAGRHLHVDIDGNVHPLGSVMWGNDPS